MLPLWVSVLLCVVGGVPLPNARQLDFMEMEFTQFMHFSIPTFWKPSDAFLRGPNPTVGGNCQAGVTGSVRDSQNDWHYPCLNANLFNPSELDIDQWMAASAALGMREICLTAKHFGGFTLWPSNFTPYGVHNATAWRGGKGDVLRDFADAARRWNISICYYCNPVDDGFLAQFGGVDALEFESRQLGMLGELLENYGPVNRFWFDGGSTVRPPNPEARPNGTNTSAIYRKAFALIHERSPSTLISPYHGDICATSETLYTNSAPQPNSSDASGCSDPSEDGAFFHPSEMHGITMQEGPDGNTDARPTYWFWHPWACAGNITGCPWVGHANASRIFDGYIATVGHGGVLNMNIAPTAQGIMNASVVEVMHEAGKAINDTFLLHSAGTMQASGPCQEGLAVLNATGDFDYIVSMEDLSRGQRIGNYSIDFRRWGSSLWETLVPPVQLSGAVSTRLRDRPDGKDPRDSHVGHKRIDVPIAPTSGIAQVRFNCIRLTKATEAGAHVYLRRLSLHKRRVPWEDQFLV